MSELVHCMNAFSHVEVPVCAEYPPVQANQLALKMSAFQKFLKSIIRVILLKSNP